MLDCTEQTIVPVNTEKHKLSDKAFYETEGQTGKKMVANMNIDLPAHPFHP